MMCLVLEAYDFVQNLMCRLPRRVNNVPLSLSLSSRDRTWSHHVRGESGFAP